MIRVENLVKTFPKKGSKERLRAVDNISFQVREGEIFALLGPNGAGKTTTLKSICGLIIPDSGEIEIMGISVLKNRGRALSNISVVLEGNRNLYWRMTPVENMAYFAGIRGKKLNRSEAADILARLGLAEKQNEIVHKLSRGMQQKTAIAVCLAAGTKILLLDEPTLGLDVNSAVEFRGLVKDLQNQGKTVLLSTHDMNLVEAVADRVAIMNDGKIVVCEEKRKLIDLFAARGYKIKLVPNGTTEEKLAKLGFSEWNKDGNVVELHLNLSSARELYKIMEDFKLNQIEIESIEKELVNFEKIFISYTNGSH
ncbi:MAG TPA: ABC transporter ATP-binding protein [Pseudothermotoga sp.]|nr:ABC transporter ATP-binding protein [Pseudothermotoga sp.]HOK82939.1 ABC transporter ATP-binding protein [Pseudothermotoga sp.]HPP69887.1 ABC transporter ATP-binding protein [Pseudothermotoga sp.]